MIITMTTWTIRMKQLKTEDKASPMNKVEKQISLRHDKPIQKKNKQK